MTAQAFPQQTFLVFDRGQRADTLRPGQGVGLAVAREITEQYAGQIIASDSLLGGARMEVVLADSIPHRKRNKHFCAFFHASR